MKTKLLIVDDHPFTRAGVRSILESNSDIVIIGEAKDGLDAVKQVIDKQPNVVVMDINMPQLSGIEATREILKKLPDIKIIALSIHKAEVFVKKMLKAGAVGYLLKDEAPEELLTAIKKVNNGDIYLSSGVTRAALRNVRQSEELQSMNVLQSKLNKPPITIDYVLRTKIIHELESNIVKPLSIVSAGAGYGKSIVVSQWLEQTAFLYSWISLDEEHNDLRTFLNYLIASIDKVFTGLLANSISMLSAPILPPSKELSNILINELCDIDQEFILVLDDYHLIKEKKVHDLMDEWLRFPPPHVHLCIIARRDPPLKIRPFRLSRRMTEIRMDKLTFTNQDIAEFFKQMKHVDLDDNSIELLQHKTEGWIIGLQMFSLIFKSQDELNQVLNTIKGGVSSLTDYLLSEVLSIQKEHIQDWLLATSILKKFCANLIEAIFEPKAENNSKGMSGTEFLQWLIKSNLFVIPLDSETKWFRYHHMFQDFLQNELIKRRDPQDIKELHTKASKWYEKNDFIAEAIDHAMKAGDTNRAVEIISKNWEIESDSDNFLTVNKWLSYLPNNVIESSVGLLFASFYSSFKGHRLDEFPLVLGLILQSKRQFTDTEKGYLAFINSMLRYYSSEGKKSLDEAEKALKYIPKKYTSFRGDARTCWFFAMLMIGKGNLALTSQKLNIDKFLKLDEPVQLGRSRTNISFYALFNADLPLLRSATIEIYKTPGLSNLMLGYYRHNLQYISWFSSDMEGVVTESEGVIDVRYEFTSRLVIDCYIMKAIALQELNKPDLATNAMKEAIEFAEYSKDSSNISVALSGSARLQLKQGEMGLALEWLNNTEHKEMDSTMLWCVEVSEITRCRLLLASGKQKDIETALQLLIKYRKFSESIYSKVHTIDILILEALAYKKLEREKEAYHTLKTAIELSAEGEWIRPFVDQQVEISDLLLCLKEDGIHPDFINTIFEAIEKRKNELVKASGSKEFLKTKKQRDSLAILTPSEIEILHCIEDGLRNQEIASKLFKSEKTIKSHIYNMFQKVNVKNRLSLVTRAKGIGIL